MVFHRTLTYLVMRSLVGVVFLIGACGGDDGPSTTTDAGGGNQQTTGDFVTLSVDGGAIITLTEASGLPSIDCDPRVDWASYQIVLWHNFTDGAGPNGYDLFFEIMFPVNDAVGSYTVQSDMLQALLYQNNVNYMASPVIANSGGTVEVTRSDERIEGTYTITVVDVGETVTRMLTGSFGVDAGWSLSCP